MTRKNVTSDKAPAAIGPYSQAIWAGDLLYLSGQTPIDPPIKKLVEGDIKAQTTQAFQQPGSSTYCSRLIHGSGHQMQCLLDFHEQF